MSRRALQRRTQRLAGLLRDVAHHEIRRKILGDRGKEPGYHSVRDFEPITGLTKNPHVFVIRSTLPAQNLNEFIASARMRYGA